ncbi:MAG: HIT family protein [Burkholderiales bacterium]
MTISFCPFCTEEGMIFRNELAHVRHDKYPVNPGHLLILTNHHVSDFFDTTHEEKLALLELLDQSKQYLTKQHAPDGFNVGVNVGEVAGQTVMHVHLHLIPRFTGDVADPRGGVRGVIPARQSY